MTQEETIMKELIEYAYERMLHNEAYPFCAFVVKDGVIVSRAFNNINNSWGDKTSHGEMLAIRKAMKSLRMTHLGTEFELYTTCQPCLACVDTMMYNRMGKLVYSVSEVNFPEYFNDHKYTFRKYIRDVNKNNKVVGGVLKEEGLHLFNTAKRKYGW